MTWTAGRPVLGLLLLAIVTGSIVATRKPSPRADLMVWVFDQSHAQMYGKALPDGSDSLARRFEQSHHQSVSIEQVNPRALDARLISLFMSNQKAQMPDLVEIDIGSVGKYLRPPPGDVGFIPLNSYLARDHLTNQILPSRLAPWSKDGQIFGLPHDLHPTTLTYRKDLFDQAGVDFESAQTWADFREACLQFQRYWSQHGFPNRRALELSTTSSQDLMMFLLQRHQTLIDSDNAVRINQHTVVDTLVFYARLVAGSEAIAQPTSSAGGFAFAELAQGNVCAMLTPDWRVEYIKTYAPELAGKLRMRSLPRFSPGDAPTTTWGGTMMAIPRSARDPETSWQLLKFLYLSDAGLAARHVYSHILPPEPAAWADSMYQQADSFFGQQRVDALYVSLAPQVPARAITEFSVAGQTALSVILTRAVSLASTDCTDAELRAACQHWLDDAAQQLRDWISHGRFDN